MRLKSIDIQGFKSFADRIKLDFTDGITAVVGPNGSGKSNIADAVRWVLGEQSTKTLRGGKMEDVIFNGTQTRRGQGVASVTLFIDNQDRTLPMEAEEVAIMRRLYRSGDSEYRINGTQVRLKDIYELFMDTGIGRDGYSIIGQGRVSEIVSARSRERREIFEEAAGISRFRYRKTEAQRQLAAAEENLNRLRDILAELEARVGPLKHQSEKAKQFLAYAGEKKKLEVSVWMQMLSGLKTKAAQLEDKLLLAQSALAHAEEQSKEQEAQFAHMQEQGRALIVEVDALRQQLERFNEQIAEGQGRRAVLQNDIAHHQQTILSTQQEMAKTGRSKEELVGEIEIKRQLILQKMEELTLLSNQSGVLEQQTTAVNAQLVQRQAIAESLKLQRGGVFEALEENRVNAASSQTILTESSSRLSEIEQTRQQATRLLLEAEREQQEARALLVQLEETLKTLQNSGNGYLLKRQSRQRRLEEQDGALQEIDQRISERRQRAKLLSDMDKNMEGFGQSVKSVMAQARSGALTGVVGPVSSLLRVEERLMLAVETALGQAMQNVVVQTQETAKRAIRQLQASKAGRATFLPVETIRGSVISPGELALLEGYIGIASQLVGYDAQYQGIIEWLLGRIILAEDLDCATAIAKKSGYRYRVVTLDGQVVNAGGSLTGGFAARSAGILGRGAEIARLEQEANALAEQRREAQQQRETTAQEVAALDAELSVLEAQRKTCGEDQIRCEAQLVAIVQRQAAAQQQQQEIDREQQALTRRVAEIREKSQNLTELRENLSLELEQLQQAVADAGQQREQLQSQRETLLRQQSSQNASILMVQRDIEAANSDIARVTLTITSNDAQRAQLHDKTVALEQSVLEAQQAIAQQAQQVLDWESACKETQEEIARRIAQRNQSEQQITQLRERDRALANERDAHYREVVRLSEQKSSADSEYTVLVAKLYDEYELTQSDAEALAQPIEDLHLANRQLAELRNKIKSLGSVNVAAIDEYSEIALRYETLTRQINDVQRAKTELTRLIDELTQQMCRIFKDKFEEINQNFSRVFVELFGGGTATLTLTDPTDLLESGIEIAVAPPGKVIKNLASLSGGEQSFVAIAIFFAILKVNPAPFCLMDEIEAALDDVNVSKFAAYLHTMTKKTQFITITHRRGTMEAADVLYGVTMQEEGVSKLLQLRVSEIEKSFVKEG